MTTKAFHLADPWALALIPLLLLLLWTQSRRARRQKPALGFSDLNLVRWSKAARPQWEGHIPLALSALSMVLLAAALARPQMGLTTRQVSKQGIDIVLCMDTSTSMQAQDLLPNRMAAATKCAEEFVGDRPDDRIGVVVFGATAVTQCPLTTDHSAVQTILKGVRIGATGTDGTALGNGIATSLNRLKDTPGKSKVVVLLTDGRNNAGEIDPLAAAKLAKTLGVKVYTVGAGTRGQAPYNVQDPFGIARQVMVRVDIDEELLMKIANETGGKYFRATDAEGLSEVYREIDRLEKSDKPPQMVTDYHELYWWFLIPALVLQAGTLIASATVLQEVP